MKKITFLIVLMANSMFLSAQIFSEDFDDETINSFTYENWVAIDADGDGRYFEVFDADSNLVDLNDDGTFDVPMNWSLSGMAVDSDSWEAGTGALTPDNFLITSNPIDLTNVSGATLSFTVATYQVNPNFLGERYSVYLTSFNEIENIVNAPAVTTRLLSDDLTAEAPDGSDSFAEITIDISEYDGQTVYLTFRHYESTDLNSFLLDDIVIDGTLGVDKEIQTNFNFFVKNKTLNLQSDETLENLKIYDYTGKQIKNIVLENKNSEAVNLESLNSGIYIAQIQIAGKTSSFKFVIN